MGTAEATQTTPRLSINPTENLHIQLFLTRGLVTIAWPAVFEVRDLEAFCQSMSRWPPSMS